MTVPATRFFAAVAIAAIAVLGFSAPVAAHTGFETSTPADGDVVVGPVTEITLVFSGEATPAGDGFEVLDSLGVIRRPDTVSSVDDLSWTLRFEQPLAAGEVGVRWMVAAPDAHPIDGSFLFTIAPPTPTTDAPSAAATENQDTFAEASTEPATGASDLTQFLDVDAGRPSAAGALATLARLAGIAGAVLVIGGSTFAVFGMRGPRADVRAVVYWVRRGGALVVAGAVVEAVTLVADLAGSWSGLVSPTRLADALWSTAGVAIALRIIGGSLAASQTSLSTVHATTVADPVLAARQLAAVGAGHSAPVAPREADEPFVYPHDHVWNPALAIGALGGAALVAISFAFDGHSASEGPRWLHAVVNLVHVTSAATWAGGVLMLVYVISRRRRRGENTQALQLAMRFSVIATVALVAAGLAGVALSVLVLDSVSAIWSTPWGRLLALKVLLVTVAAAGGAYNHRVVVPALDQTPTDPTVIDRFRRVVTLEAAALVGATVVTAFLVGASAT